MSIGMYSLSETNRYLQLIDELLFVVMVRVQFMHQNLLPYDVPPTQELAGAQAELAAHLSTKVVSSD